MPEVGHRRPTALGLLFGSMPEDQLTTDRGDLQRDRGIAGRGPALSGAWHATRAAARGHLPPRYAEWWHREFNARIDASLRPGMSILDVGAGCRPTVPRYRCPEGCRYVGLDFSRAELEKAPAGGYDDAIVADATEHINSLDGSFDLVLSYLVLEHVASLPEAFNNIRSYLVPGGKFLAYFSGTFSAFGLANRVLPSAVSAALLKSLLGRDHETVFPAFYDQCWASAIEGALRSWTTFEVRPMWFGAGYFGFLRPLQAAYIGYEEWARVRSHKNLAPYYLVEATR